MTAQAHSLRCEIVDVATEHRQALAERLVAPVGRIIIRIRSDLEPAKVLADVLVHRLVRVVQQPARMSGSGQSDPLVPHPAHKLIHAFRDKREHVVHPLNVAPFMTSLVKGEALDDAGQYVVLEEQIRERAWASLAPLGGPAVRRADRLASPRASQAGSAMIVSRDCDQGQYMCRSDEQELHKIW